MKTTLVRSVVAAWAMLLATGASAKETAGQLEERSSATLEELYAQSPTAKELGTQAVGVLVFPSVFQDGPAVGFSYGEGTLYVGDGPAAYYRIAGASFGLPRRAQKESVVLMFMTPEALREFRTSSSWRAGMNGGVAMIDARGARAIGPDPAQRPRVGFVFSNEGLMPGTSLEGSRISRAKK